MFGRQALSSQRMASHGRKQTSLACNVQSILLYAFGLCWGKPACACGGMVRPTDAGSTGVPGKGMRYGRHCFFFGAAGATTFLATARSMMTSPSSPCGCRCFMQSIIEHKLQAVVLPPRPPTSRTSATSTTSRPVGPSGSSVMSSPPPLEAAAAAALPASACCECPVCSLSSSESDILSSRCGSTSPPSLGAMVDVSSCCLAAAAACPDDEDAAPELLDAPAAFPFPVAALGSAEYGDFE
mmetsp:Transcript_57613/g.136982  ORF Transcript_57613/g.136982 Transcript_57613/m.136982 type:complete len:240 (-) Transcript_57613:609-1328(-)